MAAHQAAAPDGSLPTRRATIRGTASPMRMRPSGIWGRTAWWASVPALGPVPLPTK